MKTSKPIKFKTIQKNTKLAAFEEESEEKCQECGSIGVGNCPHI